MRRALRWIFLGLDERVPCGAHSHDAFLRAVFVRSLIFHQTIESGRLDVVVAVVSLQLPLVALARVVHGCYCILLRAFCTASLTNRWMYISIGRRTTTKWWTLRHESLLPLRRYAREPEVCMEI
jgi:hypothetical protein